MSEPGMIEPALPSAPAHRKLPMAVSIVGIIVALATLLNLAVGVLAMVALHRLGELTISQMVAAPFATVPIQLADKVYLLQPVDGAYFLVVGLIQAVLLVGYRRQRTWAWLGLMAWSGLQLAGVLYRYFAWPGDHLREYIMMAIHSVVVLTLNAQEVQEAFGLRKPPPDTVPVRTAASAPEVPKP